MEESTRSTPLLQSQATNMSDRSIDKMDFLRLQSRPVPSQDAVSTTSHAALTRPRPEIVLRWKRFALLVLLGATLISAITVTLWVGIPLTELGPNDDAEAKVALFNSYSGVIMGFVESGVSQLLGYLFPVFIVYLHNLKWSRHDDPATKPISKVKKVTLMLFFPIVMVAIGNSLSAVQTNQNGGDSAGSSRRRLQSLDLTRQASALDETLLRSITRGVHGLEQLEVSSTDDDLQRVAAGTRVVVGFPLRDWRDEVSVVKTQDKETELSQRVTRADPASSVRRGSAVISPQTSVDLLSHGLQTLQQLATDLRVDLTLPEAPFHRFEGISTPQDLLEAVAEVLATSGGLFNTSSMALELAREQLHSHVQLESLTLQVPVITAADTASVTCGSSVCVSHSTDKLLRLRSLVAASRFSSMCRSDDWAACESDPTAAFLYSSTFVSAAGSDAVEYTLSLTFAKLSWAFDDRSLELCSSPADHEGCLGLALELPHSQRHLILNTPLSPTSLLSSTSPSQPLRLVELVQPPIVAQDNQLSTITVVNKPAHNSGSPAPTVDAFASFLRENRLVGDQQTVSATLRATALLFLFQNAIVTPSAPSRSVAWQRHLLSLATTSGKDYEVFVSNTRFGAIATWIACGILFVLSALVLVLPNARARLEPPKGGNARAERFVAVQTEEVYPNLVYKKRFRIGKTGEKIKFREFAVEAVTLHHKMEEDEQIQL